MTLPTLKRIAQAASKAGMKLELTHDGQQWRWRWSNGITGMTDAALRAVAFAFACEDLAPWL